MPPSDQLPVPKASENHVPWEQLESTEHFYRCPRTTIILFSLVQGEEKIRKVTNAMINKINEDAEKCVNTSDTTYD